MTFGLAARLQGSLDGDAELLAIVDDALSVLDDREVGLGDFGSGDIGTVDDGAPLPQRVPAMLSWADRQLAGHLYWTAARRLEAARVLLAGTSASEQDAARHLVAQAAVTVGSAAGLSAGAEVPSTDESR